MQCHGIGEAFWLWPEMRPEGIGDAFVEAGTEGIWWCVIKDTNEDTYPWDLHNFVRLVDGDRLTVYAKEDHGRIVWEGTVELEFESHQETNEHGYTGQAVLGMWCHGLQRTADQEAWARYFVQNHPMVLIRGEAPGTSLPEEGPHGLP